MMGDIEEFETAQRWLDGVRADKTGSDYTQKRYIKILVDFCGWADKTPDELIEERKMELESKDEAVRRRAEERLRRYCNMLERERGWRRGTSSLYHAAIRSFYRYNYYPLQIPTPKRAATKGVQPHKPEEIRELLRAADMRENAIILGLKDSGMSRGDFVNLTYGDIKKEYENGNTFIHLSVIRKKEQVSYDTFFGPNAVSAVRTYLEYRQRMGEEIKDDSPLIVTERGPKRPLTPEALSQIFVTLSRKTGINTSSHRLRKFFESYLGLVAPSLLVKYWMGHSLRVEKSYFIPRVEEQRKAYMEAYQKFNVAKATEGVRADDIRRQTFLDMARSMLPPDRYVEVEKIFETEPNVDKAIERGNKVFKMYRLEELEKIADEVAGKTYTSSDGGNNCQKIVRETELEVMLAEGWRVAAVLPSGKVVVER